MKKRILILTKLAFVDVNPKEDREDILKQLKDGVVVIPYGYNYSVEEIDDVEIEKTFQKVDKVDNTIC